MKRTYIQPTTHVVKLQQHNLICSTQPTNAPRWSGELDSRGLDDLWDEGF